MGDRQTWLNDCAIQFMSRVKDMQNDEALMLAEIQLDEVLDGDLTECPKDAADEELSCWD
jgi:hypothetical protein